MQQFNQLPSFARNQFQGAATNAYNTYQGQQTGPDPNQYFNPALINQYFNQSRQNLSGIQGTTASQAQGDAGAFAASQGLLNPGGFVQRAGNNVYGAYAPQFGALEANRAQALQGNDIAKYNALFQQQQANRQYQLGLGQLNLQQQQFQAQSTPNAFDYLGALLAMAGLPVGGGMSLLGSFAYPSMRQGGSSTGTPVTSPYTGFGG